MKTILSIVILVVAFGFSAQAQRSADYKHPYGLTQSSKSKKVATAPLTSSSSSMGSTYVNRNYKRPQTDRGDLTNAVFPTRRVENVTNPLTANDNYKRQNRNVEKKSEPTNEEMIVQDSTLIRD